MGGKKKWEFGFIQDISCKVAIWPKMERIKYSHKGRMDFEINVPSCDGEFDCFDSIRCDLETTVVFLIR